MKIDKLTFKTTFWVLFVLVTLLFNYFINLDFINYNFELESFNIQRNLILFFIYFIYSFFIFVLVIKAANRYEGSRFLTFFAKLFVTLNLVYTMLLSFNIIRSYFLEDYFITLQIEELNESLPMKVNSFSSLDSLTKNANTIHYKYKLEGNSHIFDKLELNSFRFQEQIKESLCETPNTKNLLKKDYNLIYEYISKYNKSLVKVEAKKSDCGAGIYDLELLRLVLEQQNNI